MVRTWLTWHNLLHPLWDKGQLLCICTSSFLVLCSFPPSRWCLFSKIWCQLSAPGFLGPSPFAMSLRIPVKRVSLYCCPFFLTCGWSIFSDMIWWWCLSAFVYSSAIVLCYWWHLAIWYPRCFNDFYLWISEVPSIEEAVFLKVSEPYRRTEFTFVLNILILVLRACGPCFLYRFRHSGGLLCLSLPCFYILASHLLYYFYSQDRWLFQYHQHHRLLKENSMLRFLREWLDRINHCRVVV